MQIENLSLQTANIQQQNDYYTNLIGLKTSETTNSLEILTQTSTLHFQPEPTHKGNYHFAFNIPKNRLSAAQEFLTTKGIPLLKDNSSNTLFRFESWQADSIYFQDPDGNILEFIARQTLNNAIDKTTPFTPDEILSISEIGIACPSVATAQKQLTDIGLPTYGNPSNEFAAIGDENGLIVLVAQNRLWYPDTNIPAQLLPSQTEIVVDNKSKFIIQSDPFQATKQE